MESFREFMKKINAGRPDITSDFNSSLSNRHTNNLLQKEIVKSTASFHALILAECNDYIQKINSMEIKDYSEKKKALEELNMTSSLAYKEIIENERKLEVKETVEKFKSIFPKSIFMAWDDFKSLVIKYGLVCGTLDKYLGNIPEKNLREMMDVNRIIKQSDNVVLGKINNLIFSIKEASWYLKDEIPFNEFDDIKILLSHLKNFQFCHAEQVLQKRRIRVLEENESIPYRLFEREKGLLLWLDYSHPSQKDFLIASSPDLMKITPIGSKDIEKPHSLLKDDPIVFQILPHGIIMIHSKWGEESEDESFQKNSI